MAVPRTSLRGFLTHAKTTLRAAIGTSQKITVVIGNESAGEIGCGFGLCPLLMRVRPGFHVMFSSIRLSTVHVTAQNGF